ncbi:M56 family metallopeptidase [Flavobacterium aquidurense]|uniref:Peptidase family M56, BlaR1 n=1 Tax=Flavobacterium aquidurense TaxID=362413 RepID=A0A0Q1BN54_9FLAO|nr:M56 family metallopeptidase [Flavobacterium aquidurense]KQB42271.1 Peptidase family M56, BlaR1 [Flavobacterium aquidurense]
MEALFTFILKSGALLLSFYCAYYFLLRKETFFNSNRWFLLAGLFTSVILPFIVYTKIVWVDASPLSSNNNQIFAAQTSQQANFIFDWFFALIAIYSIGFLSLLIKFAVDFYSLNSVLKGKKVKQQADFKFVDVNENIAPFSYFDYIVYNSSLYTTSELESIIEHEKVHSEQNHTIDVLVSRVFCVLFWFNPIMWLYKKAIQQNLEFIADNEAAQKISDKKAYQYTLLKITTHENCVAITNHFYQSLIKKRIIMLNKNQSKKRNLWKFCIVIPVLVAFVLLFQIKTEAKEKQMPVKEISGEIKSVDVYKIKKSSTDEELKEIKEKLKSIHNIDFETSEIKRNAENDLTSIKIDIKNGNQQAQSIQTAGNQTIKDFGIIVTTDKDGSKKVGIQTADETSKDSKIVIEKKQKTKLNTNDNTNSNISTKTNTNSNTNSGVIITTNSEDNATTKIITSDGNSQIIVSNSGKINLNEPKLVIIDGVEMPSTFSFEDYKSGDIKTMNVLKGEMAIAKYGDKGKNGVIIIETRK